MGISIDPATLPERLRQFAKFSTEMAIAGKTSGPKELVTQSDAFSTLSKNASDLVVEFALQACGELDGLHVALEGAREGSANCVLEFLLDAIEYPHESPPSRTRAYGTDYPALADPAYLGFTRGAAASATPPRPGAPEPRRANRPDREAG